jgi:two-component system, NtrC family, response regulator AtoC
MQERGGAAMAAGAIEPREISQMDEKSPAARVLVVDDEPLIRWSLTQSLGACGFDVVESGDGIGACSAIGDASTGFDVVLLDLRLPDTDDLSLLAAIRKLLPKAQVILMTAFGTPEIVADALRLGVFRVVGKPFEIDDMANLVALAAATPQTA